MNKTPSTITERLLRYLELGHEYSRSDLLPILEFKNINAFRKGVVAKQGENFLLLYVTEQKHGDIPNYSDTLKGATLEWEGPEKHGYEQKIISGEFLLLLMYRTKNKEKFTYKGVLELIRYQPEIDIPSKFIFNLIDLEESISPITIGAYNSSLPTQKEALTKIRIGQSKFRENALELWGHKCSVTSINREELLIASHIKPWRESTDFERLDEMNCLILIPNLDRLFDAGLITFSPMSGKIILSDHVDSTFWSDIGIDKDLHLRFIPERTTEYLKYHNKYIFNYLEAKEKIDKLVN